MKKPIVAAAAAGLLQKAWLQGSETPFLLFTNVPVQCLEVNRSPILTEYATCEYLTIDLLICRGDVREAVLSVMFDTNERLTELSEAFAYDLRGMDCLFLRAEPASFPEDEAKLCAQLCAYAEHKLLHPNAERAAETEYTLPVLSLSQIGDGLERYGGAGLRQLLARRRLLSADGGVTAYGSDCGLFFQWTADKSGKPVSRPVTAKRAAYAMREALFP